MLPGWCCIAIAASELGNGDSWYHMCAFRFQSQLNQASHVRASSVPTLFACCLTKRSCHFFVRCTGRLWPFAILRSHFCTARRFQKWDRERAFLCFFTKWCMRSQKWDRQAVPFLGPCLGSFFEVWCVKVAEAQRFCFNEALWLMATGRATREALLSEAGFWEGFPDPELGPSEEAVL